MRVEVVVESSRGKGLPGECCRGRRRLGVCEALSDRDGATDGLDVGPEQVVAAARDSDEAGQGGKVEVRDDLHGELRREVEERAGCPRIHLCSSGSRSVLVMVEEESELIKAPTRGGPGKGGSAPHAPSSLCSAEPGTYCCLYMAPAKAQQKGPVPRLKIVVRRLPADLPPAVFWRTVAPWVTRESDEGEGNEGAERVTWTDYRQGKLRRRCALIPLLRLPSDADHSFPPPPVARTRTASLREPTSPSRLPTRWSRSTAGTTAGASATSRVRLLFLSRVCAPSSDKVHPLQATSARQSSNLRRTSARLLRHQRRTRGRAPSKKVRPLCSRLSLCIRAQLT